MALFVRSNRCTTSAMRNGEWEVKNEDSRKVKQARSNFMRAFSCISVPWSVLRSALLEGSVGLCTPAILTHSQYKHTLTCMHQHQHTFSRSGAQKRGRAPQTYIPSQAYAHTHIRTSSLQND